MPYISVRLAANNSHYAALARSQQFCAENGTFGKPLITAVLDARSPALSGSVTFPVSREVVFVRRLIRFCWATLLIAASAASYAENAYVPNEGSGTLTVIDTRTDQEAPVSPIPKQGTIGTKLRGVALDLSGKTLFVVDAVRNVVLAIDTASGTVKKTFTNIVSAEGIQLAPERQDGDGLRRALERGRIHRRGSADRGLPRQDPGQQPRALRLQPEWQVVAHQQRGE